MENILFHLQIHKNLTYFLITILSFDFYSTKETRAMRFKTERWSTMEDTEAKQT